MTSPKPPRSRDTIIELDKELFDSSTVSKNLTQEILVITIDKAKLCLMEHQSILRSQRNWIAPAGILIALVTSLVATDFKSFLGIKADFWQAIFVLLSIASGIWLIVTLFRALQKRGKGGVDKLIRKLRENLPETSTVQNGSQ